MNGLLALKGLGGGEARIVRAGKDPTAAASFLPVSSSPEMARILAIPRKSDMTAAIENAREEVERLVYRPGGKARFPLRQIQLDALAEARLRRGFWGPIGVGLGKTLIATLMPTVMEMGPTVVLTNAGLVKQANLLMGEYAENFYIRRDVRWVSYSILSSPTSYEILQRLKPKLIVGDEVQALANAIAARSKRFNHFMKENPETIFCGMSGSVTKRSIRDYSHLLHLSLRDWTPLPRDWKTLTEWAEALDVSDRPRPGGAIAELVTDQQLAELIGSEAPDGIARARQYINGLFLRQHNWDSEESAQVLQLGRDAVRRRIVDTPGVVASKTNELGSRLEIHNIPAPACPLIEETLRQVLDLWERPDGELLTWGLEIARVSKHVRQGGFYRWVWPKTVTDESKVAWLAARRDFRKELRDFLKERSEPGRDSPFLVEQAIKRGEIDFLTYLPWRGVRQGMRELLQGPEPPTEWVWVSKAVVEEVQRLAEDGVVAVWTDTGAVGREIAKLLKSPWYGAGPEAASEILKEKGTRTIVASIKAHGTGRNLQAFSAAIIVGCPPSGAIMEQLLGRHHRSGQEAEIVTFRVFDSFKAEMKSAIRDARYIEASTGNAQKLLTADMFGIKRDR
jgi:hypothetical protein